MFCALELPTGCAAVIWIIEPCLSRRGVRIPDRALCFRVRTYFNIVKVGLAITGSASKALVGAFANRIVL